MDERTAIVDWAVSQDGKPYIWGGTGPTGFDCSGLCYEAYLSGAGLHIPRVAAAQQAAGQSIDAGSLAPADLCFLGTPAYHVVMYIGNGDVVAADHTGVPVRTRAFNAGEFTGGFRRMTGVTGTGAGASTGFQTTNPIPGWIPGGSATDQLFHVAEGVNAVAQHLTSKTWWERVGKMGAAIVLIALALVFINRKKIEQEVKTGAKAAAVVAK